MNEPLSPSLSPEAYKRIYLALRIVVAMILVVAYFPLMFHAPEGTGDAVLLLALGTLIAITMIAMKRLVRKRLWLWTASLIWIAVWLVELGWLAMDPWGDLHRIFD
ncbi:MAG TPA: hypothetical protein VG477_07995 [Thermoanaerobaculia bacterium]|nr:hypothetical protein [Thermoanaerobaculia bacterium]